MPRGGCRRAPADRAGHPEIRGIPARARTGGGARCSGRVRPWPSRPCWEPAPTSGPRPPSSSTPCSSRRSRAWWLLTSSIGLASLPATRSESVPSSRDVVFVDGVRTPFGRSGPEGAVRGDPRRRPGRPRHPRADAAQPATAARARGRGRHRRDHPDRRPGPDHRPLGRGAGRAAQDRARLRHRPHVRGRDDRGDHGRRRHRLRRLRRRHRGRRRAHGPPPDGRGRRPQPAVPVREARRPDPRWSWA